MKRTLTLSLAAICTTLLLSGCIFINEDGYLYVCPEPSGYVETTTRTVPEFWSVKVLDSSVRVYIEQSDYQYVDVVADDNIENFIETRVASDGVLEIWWDGPNCTSGGIREVYVGGDYIQVLKRNQENASVPDTLK